MFWWEIARMCLPKWEMAQKFKNCCFILIDWRSYIFCKMRKSFTYMWVLSQCLDYNEAIWSPNDLKTSLIWMLITLWRIYSSRTICTKSSLSHKYWFTKPNKEYLSEITTCDSSNSSPIQANISYQILS